MTAPQPDVAIVIPCYNSGRWLPEAVDSALAQVGVRVEVLVADDGSTDPDTVQALTTAEAAGARVQKLPHRGVSAARNAAIARTSARYLVPLDADDRIAPTFAAQAAERLDADPQLGIVSARAEFFGAASGEATVPHVTMAALLLHEAPLLVTSMFRRADWVATGGFDEELAYGEDIDLWFALLSLGRTVEQLPDVLVGYRQHEGQATADPHSRVLAQQRMAALFVKYLHLYRANSYDLMVQLIHEERLLAAFDRDFSRVDRVAATVQSARRRASSWLNG